MSITIPAKYLETRYNENNYFIGVFSTLKKFVPTEYISDSDKRLKVSFSVKGYSIPTNKKFNIMLTGDFKQEQAYGLTFYAKSAVLAEPSDIDGIQDFLCSFVKGVGPKTAKSITDKFGENTLEIIENEPERLYEVHRLRKATVNKILDSYIKTKDNAKIVKLLSPFGLSGNTIMKIKTYLESDKRTKKMAVEKIKENPFILSKIRGIGFETLDTLSTKFHCNPLAPERIEACLIYELEKAMTYGHLYLEQRELLQRTVNTLNIGYAQNTVTAKNVAETMKKMARCQDLLGDYGNAYTASNYTYETISANRVVDYLTKKVDNVNISDIIPKVERKLNLSLAEKQKEAVNMAVNNKFSMILGSAGTGKTTVLKAVLNTLLKLKYRAEDICLAAPTGRAAQRMSEVTGFQAQTIHSLLGLQGEYETEHTEHLTCSYLIIDEASMLDQYIFYKIMTNTYPDTTRILLLGDTGQLPSVGAGNVLYDLVKSSYVPFTELNVIFRQSQDNIIIKNSHNIRYGRERVYINDDFSVIREPNQQNAANIITSVFLNEVARVGLDNVICISPLRDKGFCSAQEINKRIQSLINPPSLDRAEKLVRKTLFRERDRVIQCQNMKCKTVTGKEIYISNGCIGYITSIRKNENQYIFTITFEGDNVVEFNSDDMLSIKLAYALTVHKAQGAEFSSVIMPLFSYFGLAMLYRNMLYTAVTRAKERFTIIGEPECINRCIRNNRITHRNTYLAKRISAKYLIEQGG